MCPAWHVPASGSVRPALSRLAIAILDDYQDVARSYAPWDDLDADVTVFTDHVDGAERLADRLAPFDVLVAMRERTPFGADLLARLPRLRLLVTTGMANAAIDLEAATAHGVVVCGTRIMPGPTAEPHLGADPRAAAAHPRGARQCPRRRLADHGRRRARTA